MAAKLLTAREVAAIKTDGRHSIGDGLYLEIVGNARRWFTRYTIQGRRREMQLGSATDVSLKEARERVADIRMTVKAGIDPIERKKAVEVEEAKTPSFGAFADELIGTIESGFRNEKHIYQWKQTLGEAYCASIRKKAVDAVTTEDIIDILKPLWATKQETASRLRGRIDDELLEQLEEVLISSDIGFDTTQDLIKELRNRIRRVRKTNSKDFNWLAGTLRDLIHEMQEQDNRELQFAPTGPTIYLVIGVNGVGKTTAIGKMAYRFKNQGKKVLLVAADTFRAAAIEQLVLWSEEADVPIVAGKERSDPSSVVYTAMTKAKETQPDIVIIDTAGRLHTKHNLMQELAKMSRVISRDFEGAPHETLLVLDAATGQNALSQARVFMESCGITGLILTKLDGTAKGGIVLALHKQLQLPVKFIGVGEEIEDLEVFNPDLFSRAIFPLDPIEGEMPPESTPVSTASS